MDALGGDDPFIMEADGSAGAVRAFGPEGWAVADLLRARRKPRPQSYIWPADQSGSEAVGTARNEFHEPEDPRYPYVFTTYRLTELHCGGISSRVTPHTAELQPEAFVELSPELAADLGIANLDWTVLGSARGEIEVKALVTERMRPFVIMASGYTRSECRGYLAGTAMPMGPSQTCCWAYTATQTPASIPPRRSPVHCAKAGWESTMATNHGHAVLEAIDKLLARTGEGGPRFLGSDAAPVRLAGRPGRALAADARR